MVLMIIQIGFLLVPIILSFFYPIQNILYIIVDSNKLENFINTLTDNVLYISIICGFLLSIIIYLAVIKFNKNRIFNKGDNYFDYSYETFWFAAKILRFEKVSLVRVPIYMQFKLILNDIFPVVNVNDSFVNDGNSIKEKDIEIKIIQNNNIHDEMNLVLIDTYNIKRNEIPLNKVELPTIIIKSGNHLDGNRTVNSEFIEGIRAQTNYYQKKYNKVNIFATTNTNHNKLIIKKCFKNANRTGFKEVNVYQANRENHKFEDKYSVI